MTALNNLFYSTQIHQDSVTLTEQEAVHCALVLRKKVGDVIYTVDGNGNRYKCGIDSMNKREVKCTILATESQKKTEHITIAIAPTKNRDRLEWMIEKLVEIGVERIVLMNTNNTERTRTNMDRIQKKVISAVKQSLRFYIPEVIEMDFSEILKQEVDERYIAHCYDDLNKGKRKIEIVAGHPEPSQNVDLRSLILIGPEGDFTKTEVEQALALGFQGLDLGEYRLRTETAAIVAVARFQ